VPKKGDRIELVRSRAGVHTRGTVHHVDQVQILVKWDDGRSQSLRSGVDRFRIIEPSRACASGRHLRCRYLSHVIVWVLVGVAVVATVPLVVGLAVAAALGQIGREITELLECEGWRSAPLTAGAPMATRN
jgi:hypothetical protein